MSTVKEDDLQNYREVLRHIVRPDDPDNSDKMHRMRLHDYEALWLRSVLREYAAYYSDTAEKEKIALGLIEYIDMVVRKEGRTTPRIYLHSQYARDVVSEALEHCADWHDTLKDEVLTHLTMIQSHADDIKA